MTVRNSLDNSKVITLGLLLAGLWIVVVALDVIGVVQASLAVRETIGRTAFTGFLGLLVMAAFLVGSLFLYGELATTEPAPSSWPPE